MPTDSIRPSIAAALTLALLCGAPAASQGERSLAEGLRQVHDGEFEAALTTLDLVARGLAGDATRSKELAQAYAYMGVAYLGLRQEGLARLRFLRALSLDAGLSLSVDEFPARAIRAFEAAREQHRGEAGLAKEAGKKRGKGGLILLGVGGAAAAGIGVVVTRPSDTSNQPPGATITVSPEGTLVAGTTRATFTAAGNDPDGDALTYQWAFDAQGVLPESGPTAARIFPSPASVRVTLTVSDGRSSVQVPTTVRVESVTGIWRLARPAPGGETHYRIEHCVQQCNPNLELVEVYADARLLVSAPSGGGLRDPRNIELRYDLISPGERCGISIDGELDSTLRTMTGRYHCSGAGCGCNGATLVTLSRQ